MGKKKKSILGTVGSVKDFLAILWVLRAVITHPALKKLVENLKPAILNLDELAKTTTFTLFDDKVVDLLKQVLKMENPEAAAGKLEEGLADLDRAFLDSKHGAGDLDPSNYWDPARSPDKLEDLENTVINLAAIKAENAPKAKRRRKRS